MRRMLFVAIAVSALCNAGCTKVFRHKVPINRQLKENFCFLEGSWWVMQDSLSGRTDSLYISKYSDVYVSHESHGVTYENELVHFTMSQHSLEATAAADSFTYQVIMSDKLIKGDLLHYGAIVPKGTFLQNYFDINYPYDPQPLVTTTSGAITSGAGITARYATFVVGSNTFSNVLEYVVTYSDAGAPPYAYTDTLDLCPGTGIVRMVQSHPADSMHHVWRLQRWHTMPH